MSNSDASRRIIRELKELQKNPSKSWVAAPNDDNLFEWFFTVRGPAGSEFEDGRADKTGDLSPDPLVGPGARLGTAQVVRALDGAWSDPARVDGTPADLGAVVQELAQRRNDLQATAQRLEPAIGDALDALSRRSGCLLARMSGSGPVCFGIFDSQASAATAAAAIAGQRPGWWVCATETIAADGSVSA